jgi:hypothetical protein
VSGCCCAITAARNECSRAPTHHMKLAPAARRDRAARWAAPAPAAFSHRTPHNAPSSQNRRICRRRTTPWLLLCVGGDAAAAVEAVAGYRIGTDGASSDADSSSSRPAAACRGGGGVLLLAALVRVGWRRS